MKQTKQSGSGTRYLWKTSFSDVIASGVDRLFDIISAGAGISVSQSAGNLLIAAGTTANSETILRSKDSFSGHLTLRYAMSLSQRIVDNNFFVELVDVVKDNAAFVINSATSVTVTVPEHSFSAANVGQSMYLGGFTGTAGTIPGRYAIAAVSGDDITFTVAGFPGAGSGTVDLFGWNYYHMLYDGTVVTGIKFDAQGNGWASGDTTITANTSASPGHMINMVIEDGACSVYDQLVAQTVSVPTRIRGQRYSATPDSGVELFVQIRCTNGSTAPASSTTAAIGFVSVEDAAHESVSIGGIRTLSFQNPLPVLIAQGSPGTATGSVGVSMSDGQAAHDAVVTGNPVRMAGRALTANYTAVATGDTSDLVTTLVGALVTKPFSIPEADWTYAAASGGIVNTTDVAAKAAAGAGLRNYVTSFQFRNANAVATEFVIKDGSTVIWRGYAAANMTAPEDIVLNTPLKTTANAALNVACITTGAQLYFNAQGYVAP